MGILLKFSVSATDFELGRILTIVDDAVIEFEAVVPLGESTVPLFWVHGGAGETVLDALNDHSAVRSATEVESFDDRTLFKLDWDAASDELLTGITDRDGTILSAVRRDGDWIFRVIFCTHKRLGSFSAYCDTAGIPMKVRCVCPPATPDDGPNGGLSGPQLEALSLAIEHGYYDIPRDCSTQDLADELGISDQAVTERLRRAIVSLSTETLDAVNTNQ